VALLHDREADTLATWLRGHPEIAIIARDRLKAYRDGACAGAPQATQVADRFHLLQNFAEALDHVFSTHGQALEAVSEVLSHTPLIQPDSQTAVPVPPGMPTPQEQARAQQRRSRRLATYAQAEAAQAPDVWARHARPAEPAVPTRGVTPAAAAPPTGGFAHGSPDYRAAAGEPDAGRSHVFMA
jgi:transposase